MLTENNLSVLPCIVNTTGYSAAKQKTLARIKTEKVDMNDMTGSHDDIRRQLMIDTDTTNTMDEIIEKYKDHI